MNLKIKIMTQEEENLLLRDLSARLPYGVKARVYNHWRDEFQDETITIENLHQLIKTFSIEDIKPYLFPLSSMNEEQKKEYDSIIYHNIELHCERYYDVIDVDCYEELHDFYHKNHLDYRNLIGKGLANDASKLNIY